MSEPHAPRLRTPKGRFQETIRKLAEAAMSITHHDASDHEDGYINEVRAMEEKFTHILRGKIKPDRAAKEGEG